MRENPPLADRVGKHSHYCTSFIPSLCPAIIIYYTLIECQDNHTVTTCVLRIATAATMLVAEDVANIWLLLVGAVVVVHMMFIMTSEIIVLNET
jgi:hypothetical protein